MSWIMWTGAGIMVLGFIGIMISIVMITRAKGAGLDDAALRARLEKILPVNLGSLFVAVIGVMTVIIGLILG